MIFTPYPDEMQKINTIQKYNSSDYALLRLTFTMIDKNNIDANSILRDMLYNQGIVDYDALEFGGVNGITVIAKLILPGKIENVKLKFYRVTNSRGDRRFSIEAISKKSKEQLLCEGDLLYISVLNQQNEEAQIVLINLNRNTPGEQELQESLGFDDVHLLLEELKPTLRGIVNLGYHNNSKGLGSNDPKDVGDTLEALLGIETNNRGNADYKGKIEIKAKAGNTKDTLFTLRPCFDGTFIAGYEDDDKRRVSAFTRYYGYHSDNHPGSKSLYITIGAEAAPQNNLGFYLEVNDEARRVELRKMSLNQRKNELTAFWSFSSLKNELYQKHPATLWVTAETRLDGDMVQFKYKEIMFSRSPQFTTFLSLIKTGVVTYDWRGYTSAKGNYYGKNHGNAWRVKPKWKDSLFGVMEPLAI